jgi:hypothetical protein
MGVEVRTMATIRALFGKTYHPVKRALAELIFARLLHSFSSERLQQMKNYVETVDWSGAGLRGSEHRGDSRLPIGLGIWPRHTEFAADARQARRQGIIFI